MPHRRTNTHGHAHTHRKRGYCCGNRCRHCPYGWENVGKDKGAIAAAARAAKKKMGGESLQQEDEGEEEEVLGSVPLPAAVPVPALPAERGE